MTNSGAPTQKEFEQVKEDKDLEDAKAFQSELIALSNKYDVKLVPVTTIMGNSISTRIEIMKNPKQSNIITPK